MIRCAKISTFKKEENTLPEIDLLRIKINISRQIKRKFSRKYRCTCKSFICNNLTNNSTFSKGIDLCIIS